MKARQSLVAVADGRKPGYQMALAMQEKGLLNSFVTSSYFDQNNWINQKVARLYPRSASRYIPGIQSRNVTSLPLVDIIRNLRFWITDSDRLANDYFDKQVKRKLDNQEWLLTTNDCCSFHAISRAKELGIKVAMLCIVPSNTSWQAISQEEYVLHPQLRNSTDAFVTLPKWILSRREIDFYNSDILIAYSPFIKSTLLDEGIDERKIIVVPKGTDDSKYYDNMTSLNTINLSPPREKFHVLFVGNLTWRKGIFYIIESLKKASLPNTKLTLVGGGTEWLSLIENAKQYLNIEVVGSVSPIQVNSYYQSSDVFFFPSLLEGSAQVTFEAMAHGLPIITTPNSGSFVEDGIDGFIVPIRDTDAMASRLVQLYEDVDLRLTMKKNALTKSQRFTWSKYREGIRNALIQYSK